MIFWSTKNLVVNLSTCFLQYFLPSLLSVKYDKYSIDFYFRSHSCSRSLGNSNYNLIIFFGWFNFALLFAYWTSFTSQPPRGTISGVPKGGSIYPQALKFCPKWKILSTSPYFLKIYPHPLCLTKIINPQSFKKWTIYPLSLAFVDKLS